MTRIIVEIEGGLVQAIWSTDETIKAEIMNKDLPENDEDCDSCIREIDKCEAEIINLKMVDISRKAEVFKINKKEIISDTMSALAWCRQNNHGRNNKWKLYKHV